MKANRKKPLTPEELKEAAKESRERQRAKQAEKETVLVEDSDAPMSEEGSASDDSTDEDLRECMERLQEQISRTEEGIQMETSRAADREKLERERLRKEKKEERREAKRKEIERSRARLAELKEKEERLKEARRKTDGKAKERRESVSRQQEETILPSTPVREEEKQAEDEDEDEDEKLQREIDEAVTSPEESLRLARLLGFETVFELARCARGLKKSASAGGLSPAESRRKKRTKLDDRKLDDHLRSPQQKRRRSPGMQDTPAAAPPKKKNAWDTCGKEVSRADLPARQAFVVPAGVVKILKEGFQVRLQSH